MTTKEIAELWESRDYRLAFLDMYGARLLLTIFSDYDNIETVENIVNDDSLVLKYDDGGEDKYIRKEQKIADFIHNFTELMDDIDSKVKANVDGSDEPDGYEA